MHISGDGNFTVFAPNNDAFEKIPEDVLSDVFADKDKLTGNLLYQSNCLNLCETNATNCRVFLVETCRCSQ